MAKPKLHVVSLSGGKDSIAKRYDNSTQFYKDYFGSDIETLVKLIKKYKQSHGAHEKDEDIWRIC